jgi:hypothetical protein
MPMPYRHRILSTGQRGVPSARRHEHASATKKVGKIVL